MWKHSLMIFKSSQISSLLAGLSKKEDCEVVSNQNTNKRGFFFFLTWSSGAQWDFLSWVDWRWLLSATGAWTGLEHTNIETWGKHSTTLNLFSSTALIPSRYRSCCRSSGCSQSGTAFWPERCTPSPPSPGCPWSSSGHIYPGSTILKKNLKTADTEANYLK